jgi:SAM-dependent methyltransferase
MLDYACGSGVVSKALKQHFSTVIGVDISGSMLDKYRKVATDLGLAPGEMVGVLGDLLSDDVQPTVPPLPEDALYDFDLVVVSLALHHFSDPALALQRLAARLKAGGVLLIITSTPLDGSTPAQREYEEELRARGDSFEDVAKRSGMHGGSHTVNRPNGFTRQEMADMFRQAGCTNVREKLAERLSSIPVINAKAQLFWIRASKPA